MEKNVYEKTRRSFQGEVGSGIGLTISVVSGTSCREKSRSGLFSCFDVACNRGLFRITSPLYLLLILGQKKTCLFSFSFAVKNEKGKTHFDTWVRL